MWEGRLWSLFSISFRLEATKEVYSISLWSWRVSSDWWEQLSPSGVWTPIVQGG